MVKKEIRNSSGMDRRRWLKTGLGLVAVAGIPYSVEAEEIYYAGNIHPMTGRWMVPDSTGVASKVGARLNSNENPYGPSERAKQGIIQGFQDANRYSRAVADSLRQKIADYEKVSSDQIFLFAGLSELLNLLASLTGWQGGEMISAHPTFDLMPAMAKRLGGKWIQVPLNARYEHDLPAMEAAISSQTKLIYICNPGNPSGTMVDPDLLKRFVQKNASRALIFIDEAYIDYVPEADRHSIVSLAKTLPGVVVGKTLSKIHGFAGLRIGYSISSSAIASDWSKYHAWDYSLAAPVMHGAIATLDDEGFKSFCLKKVNESKARVSHFLHQKGYQVLPSYTNFLIFPISMPGADFVAAMASKGIALRSWYFDQQNWCRVSIGTDEEMDLFVEAMKTI
jgi:histidinol-phosphate aminotransferase